MLPCFLPFFAQDTEQAAQASLQRRRLLRPAATPVPRKNRVVKTAKNTPTSLKTCYPTQLSSPAQSGPGGRGPAEGAQGSGNAPAETQGPGSLQLGWTRAGRPDVSDPGTEPEWVASHGGADGASSGALTHKEEWEGWAGTALRLSKPDPWTPGWAAGEAEAALNPQ